MPPKRGVKRSLPDDEWSASPPALGASEDTVSHTTEDQWFYAAKHREYLDTVVDNYDGGRHYHFVDMFPPHRRGADVFMYKGLQAVSCDIRGHSENFDITSKDGFLNMLNISLALLPGGLCLAGPPCSLFIFLSQSYHRRSDLRPEGDEEVAKVRMANLIAQNFAVLAEIIMDRHGFIMVEQPANSWMFKLPAMNVLKLKGCFTVHTWLCEFSHPMLKPTILLTNLPVATMLNRKLTRKQLQERKSDPAYGMQDGLSYLRHDSKGGVSGSRRLAETATYPFEFLIAIEEAWAKDFDVHVRAHPLGA